MFDEYTSSFVLQVLTSEGFCLFRICDTATQQVRVCVCVCDARARVCVRVCVVLARVCVRASVLQAHVCVCMCVCVVCVQCTNVTDQSRDDEDELQHVCVRDRDHVTEHRVQDGDTR